MTPCEVLEKELHACETAELLRSVSSDRIRSELNTCFRHDTMKTILVLTQYPLILKVITARVRFATH